MGYESPPHQISYLSPRASCWYAGLESWWSRVLEMVFDLLGRVREAMGGTPAFRPIWRRLPSRRRCKACLSPFEGLFSLPFRAVGIRPARKNPKLCTL